MTTATTPARNGRLFAEPPPEPIRAALEAVVLADRGFFADRMAFKQHGYSPERSERLGESSYQLATATEAAERLLEDYLGEPAFKFDPCDFGDAYTKRTWLWGHFTPPNPLLCEAARSPSPRELVQVNWTDKQSGQGAGKRRRSTTPKGFAQAFFQANA